MRHITSAVPHFRTLGIDDRRRVIAALFDTGDGGDASGLDERELIAAFDVGGIDAETADRMVENALGTFALPFGVALNVRVNGKDHLVPMATEEPSVIAAASHAAKRVRAAGGFSATMDAALTAGQIEVHDVLDPEAAIARVHEARAELLCLANAAIPNLVARGGGAREIAARDLGEGFVVTHVLVDCCDAMGANTVNTVAEAVGARIAELTGGELGLRILSNYCDRRVARVTARLPVDHFGCAHTSGLEAARGVARASRFAELDMYRAVTHNKGIMNGVDAVVIATGNDSRATEAAAHAYAARNGRYEPLATWRLDDEERVLEGKLEIPLALGTVGGALRVHRAARAALALLQVASSAELAMVTAAAGLATNLSALRALATEGIQRGHMALHRRATPVPAGS